MKTKKSLREVELGFGHHAILPVLAVLLIALIGIRALTASHAAQSFTQTSGRPFASNSAWNSPIISQPTIDSNNTSIVTALNKSHGGIADLYEYGVPIWNSSNSSPLRTITCTEPWGRCALSLQPLHIPANARPSSGTDGAMVVINWSLLPPQSYEFWQAQKQSSGNWKTSWGGIVTDVINGSGSGGDAVGAGISRLAGVVRTFEISQGHIDHALIFSSSDTCSKTYRFPATKTDGNLTTTACIPEGARIQLDPSINVDAIPSITPAEKIIAHTLQTYGAYCIDTGGTPMAYVFEVAKDATPSFTGKVYTNSGLASDYQLMSHIPWSKIRVLAGWNN